MIMQTVSYLFIVGIIIWNTVEYVVTSIVTLVPNPTLLH